MPAAYLLLRLPDLIIGFLDLTAISVPLACASDAIQITAFIVSSLQVPYSRVVTPPSLLRPPPLFSAKLLLRVTFCSLIRPPTYTCTHVFGLLLPQCLL